MSAIGDLVVNLVTKTQQFTQPLTGAIGSMAGFVSRIRSMTGTLGQLTAGLSVAAALGWGVSLAAEAEQAKIAFTTMLGSATQAKTLLGELSRFAATTPYESPEVISAGKQLLAYGIEAEKIVPTLRKLGDIASGVGAPLGDIAYLFGTAKTQGRLFAQDINQFTNRGIPIIAALAKTMGVADDSVKAMVSAGQVGFPQLSAAIDHLSGSGSRFGGLMEKQSRSLTGLWSTMKDNIGLSLTKIAEAMLHAFDVRGIIESTGNGLGSIQRLIEANYGPIVALGNALKIVAKVFGVLTAAAIAYSIAQRTATVGAIVFQSVMSPANLVKIGASLAAAGLVVAAMDAGFQAMAADVPKAATAIRSVATVVTTTATETERLRAAFSSLPAVFADFAQSTKTMQKLQAFDQLDFLHLAGFDKRKSVRAVDLFPDATKKVNEMRELHAALTLVKAASNLPGEAGQTALSYAKQITEQIGRVSGAAAAIAAAQEQLDIAKFGERAVQKDKLFDAGATLGQVRELDSLLDKLDEVKRKQDEVRHSAELRDRGQNMITALKDDIDLLTGAATRADIELRKLREAGLSKNQIDEIAKLQKQKEQLEKDKAITENSGPNFAAALTKGSSEAISVINRAAFRPEVSYEKKIAELNKKQLDAQERMAVALEKKPKVEESVFDF